jgi:hypothetical protein
MSYTIKNTDGTILTILADGKVDQSSSSLALIGKNVSGFGEYLNNNLIKLLENGANTNGSPPRSPLTGQLWYDTTLKKLKVYDNGFKTLGGVIISDTSEAPPDLVKGDLWYDSTKGQVKMYVDGNNTITVGPLYDSSVGNNGWFIPEVSLKDNENNALYVNVLQNYGKSIGLMSDTSFTLSTEDSRAYFSMDTKKVVAGLNIKGDISYTGKTDEKQLSFYIDLETLASTISNIGSDVGNNLDFNQQNSAICIILATMYPINTGDTTIQYSGYTNIIPDVTNQYTPYFSYTSYSETGVPIGSICKVLCRYVVGTDTNPNSGGQQPGYGYQVRRFIATYYNGDPQWRPHIHTEVSLQF